MGAFIKVPVSEVQKPKQGFTVIKDHWWLVEDGCVLGFKLYGEKSKVRPSPQCNIQKEMLELVLKRHPSKAALFIPVVYWWK